MAKKMGSKAEWRRFKKFEQENERLRKEVSKLRKQVKSSFEDKLEQRANRIKDNKPAVLPACERCGNTDIHFMPIERSDGKFEIRICKSCQHKTELKQKKKK